MPDTVPFHGTDEPLLDHVHECMNGARIQAELGLTYAQIGDVIGLEYATRNLVAYVKAAIPSVKDLKASREARAAARGPKEPRQ